jgi:tetratricopeptide (TPR) repeat protein
MRKLILGILIVLWAGVLQPSAAISTADKQQRPVITLSMTVAELENKGDALRAVKDYEGAIQCFQAALRKDRKNAVLYNKLGLAELQNGDSRAARSHFDKAAKINPKYANAINNVGAADYLQKNYGQAARYFKKALALQETSASYHANLGAAWFAQNKLERAIAEYTRAVELDPDVFRNQATAGVSAQIASPEERARYQYLLAKIYAQRGDVNRCLECLKKAKEEGYRNLGNVYKDKEFAGLWQDVRLGEVIPAPAK